jgi:hypothetical protein
MDGPGAFVAGGGGGGRTKVGTGLSPGAVVGLASGAGVRLGPAVELAGTELEGATVALGTGELVAGSGCVTANSEPSQSRTRTASATRSRSPSAAIGEIDFTTPRV